MRSATRERKGGGSRCRRAACRAFGCRRPSARRPPTAPDSSQTQRRRAGLHGEGQVLLVLNARVALELDDDADRRERHAPGTAILPGLRARRAAARRWDTRSIGHRHYRQNFQWGRFLYYHYYYSYYYYYYYSYFELRNVP